MEWLVWMVAVAILGLAAVAASGRLGEFPATVTDTPQPHVPSGRLSGTDLRALRFAVVARGYSMQQVDDLLDRLSRQLDQEPAEFTGSALAEDDPVPAPDWEPEVRGAEGEPVEHTGTEPQPPLHEELEPVAVDELAAEIAQIGADEAVVADYGAGLDDLVSKYPFRKVEHWYELPGFDTPAPPASDPADQADDAAPSHGATAEPT